MLPVGPSAAELPSVTESPSVEAPSVGAPSPDLPRGGAAEAETNARLSFCADCRQRLDRLAHPIHFCDRCGGSVPLDLVESGTALSADGRILCAACRRSVEIDARGPVFWAVVCAVLAAIVGVVLAVFV